MFISILPIKSKDPLQLHSQILLSNNNLFIVKFNDPTYLLTC